MELPPRSQVDTATARHLAVEADADPRSVRRELRAPGSVRGMAGHRIRAVLAMHGYVHATEEKQP